VRAERDRGGAGEGQPGARRPPLAHERPGARAREVADGVGGAARPGEDVGRVLQRAEHGRVVGVARPTLAAGLDQRDLRLVVLQALLDELLDLLRDEAGVRLEAGRALEDRDPRGNRQVAQDFLLDLPSLARGLARAEEDEWSVVWHLVSSPVRGRAPTAAAPRR